MNSSPIRGQDRDLDRESMNVLFRIGPWITTKYLYLVASTPSAIHERRMDQNWRDGRWRWIKRQKFGKAAVGQSSSNNAQ